MTDETTEESSTDVTSDVTLDDLRAVHHPARRRMIDHLAANGPAQVGTLARELGEQVGSISHHLRMLQRAGVVEPAPELSTDGRTSWWRLVSRSISWSVEDFTGPGERMQAEAAERANVRHQGQLLSSWSKARTSYAEEWRRCAFSSDVSTRATAEELDRLAGLLADAINEWRDGIDLQDGQEREPVFVFTHGFPMVP